MEENIMTHFVKPRFILSMEAFSGIISYGKSKIIKFYLVLKIGDIIFYSMIFLYFKIKMVNA